MDGTTKQRYISTSIWADGWFDSLSVMEKLIYFYLLTNNHTTIAGVYPLALKYICADTGCSREEVNAAMTKFENAGKAYFYREYIIIPKWLKHQKIKERSGLFLGAVKVLKSLPDEIKAFIADRRHYDYDISKYIEMSLTPPQDLPKTSLIPPQDPPPNLAHDLDLDSDSDSDLDNTTDTGKTVKKPKTKKPPLRERKPENDMEKVEKAYLLNWDILFSQGKVKTPNPIVNWTQTRSLLKNHFKSLVPEQIIRAVNNGMADDFILQGGYSLATMLSATVLNRLINSDAKTGQKHRIANDFVDQRDANKYFLEA